VGTLRRPPFQGHEHPNRRPPPYHRLLGRRSYHPYPYFRVPCLNTVESSCTSAPPPYAGPSPVLSPQVSSRQEMCKIERKATPESAVVHVPFPDSGCPLCTRRCLPPQASHVAMIAHDSSQTKAYAATATGDMGRCITTRCYNPVLGCKAQGKPEHASSSHHSAVLACFEKRGLTPSFPPIRLWLHSSSVGWLAGLI
jgi:hypothetical protein